MKEIKEDTNREIYHALDWKTQYCENNYIAQRTLYIQYNLYQSTNGTFKRTRTTTKLPFVWKHNRPSIGKANLRKKNTAEEIRFPDFRLYYKDTVTKTLHYLHRNRNKEK